MIIIDLITLIFEERIQSMLKAFSNENPSYSTLCCHLGIAVPGTKPHFVWFCHTVRALVPFLRLPF